MDIQKTDFSLELLATRTKIRMSWVAPCFHHLRLGEVTSVIFLKAFIINRESPHKLFEAQALTASKCIPYEWSKAMVTQNVGVVLHSEVTKRIFSHSGGRSLLRTHFKAKYFPGQVIYLNFCFPVNFMPFQDMLVFILEHR